MSVNDRLYDELLKPVVEDYYETATAVGQLMSVPATSDVVRTLCLQERLTVLEQTGDRIARVLELPEPLWEEMRGLAGVPEWVQS